MNYDASDSSGTDDDLPLSHQNRDARELMAKNGRSVVGVPPYPRVQNDMETQIHLLEQEAYSSVLRAFKAQADAITWEQESLITNLRKELRVSDDEHRELLSRVNAEDIIRIIREWRQEARLLRQPVHDPASSPTVSSSRKRQNISLSAGAPSPVLHAQGIGSSMQQSSTSGKLGVAPGTKDKKPKSGQILPGGSTVKPSQYPSSNPAEACDPLIGQKVMIRWPLDDMFYEAVITDYNPEKDEHAFVYYINTNHESWEWVNVKEISPEDIQWEGKADRHVLNQAYHGGPGRGIKKSIGRGGVIRGAGRGRGPMKAFCNRAFVSSKNGGGKRGYEEIKIFHTQILIKEAEQVFFSSTYPDPFKVEKIKKMLKEHEQSLIDAISWIANASNGESDAGSSSSS